MLGERAHLDTPKAFKIKLDKGNCLPVTSLYLYRILTMWSMVYMYIFMQD